jgi:hypothetical protein
VIKFVSGLRQVGVFFPGIPVFSTNKTDRHQITEILLKLESGAKHHNSKEYLPYVGMFLT